MTDPSFGFDKASRNAAENAAANAPPAPLDPAFPFTVQAFDPRFFNLPNLLVKLGSTDAKDLLIEHNPVFDPL